MPRLVQSCCNGFWYGAWALYGDFDVEAVYDQLGGDNFLNFTVAMLLWIYTGLTTIFDSDSDRDSNFDGFFETGAPELHILEGR